MAVMAGIFPDGRRGIDLPEAMEAWPSNWSPIPIHTVDYETDHVRHSLHNETRLGALFE